MKSKNVSLSSDSETSLQDTNVVQCDPEKRSRMIAMSAYFRAEKRHFSPSDGQADWLASEKEVDRHLSSFSS